MEVKTLEYRSAGAWSQPIPKEMDSKQTMVLVFAGINHGENSRALADLSAAFPNSILFGCSTAGEISGGEILDNCIVVAIAKFAKTRLRMALAPLKASHHSQEVGETLGDQLYESDLQGIFVLSDGILINGSELIRGLNKFVPKEVVVTGGLAGDGHKFQTTWIIHQGVPRTEHVVAVGFYGTAIRMTHGCKGGWDVFGPERMVTRSKGNVLYELDDKPALPLYKDYLGSLAAKLPSSALMFPISLRRHALDSKAVLRTVAAIDEKMESMTFAGDIPQGFLAQIMRANFERLITGASESAFMSLESSHHPTLAIAISCVNRRLVLGERAKEEIEAGRNAFPPGTSHIGFYSYGEISPVRPAVACEFHNQTMTYTTFNEHG